MGWIAVKMQEWFERYLEILNIAAVELTPERQFQVERGFDSLLNAAVIRCFRARSYAGSDRVEIDIGHARKQRLFGFEGLRSESAFPEFTGALIFKVRLSGDGLIEAAHEPADTGELAPPDIDDVAESFEFGGGERFTAPISLNQKRAFKQGAPSVHDLIIREAVVLLGMKLENEVIVIAHYGIGADIDSEQRREQSNSIDDPLPAMFVVSSRIVIDAAEKGAANAARRDVVVGCISK